MFASRDDAETWACAHCGYREYADKFQEPIQVPKRTTAIESYVGDYEIAEVKRLVAAGVTQKRIAQELGINDRTVNAINTGRYQRKRSAELTPQQRKFAKRAQERRVLSDAQRAAVKAEYAAGASYAALAAKYGASPSAIRLVVLDLR